MDWLKKLLKDLFQKPNVRIIENKSPEPVPKPIDRGFTDEIKEDVPASIVEEGKFQFEADPLDYLTCAQKFGERPEFYAKLGSPKGHNGMDFRTWVNGDPNNWKTNVYSVMSGKVLEAREDTVYGKGNYVRLDHGSRGQTVYLHLSSIKALDGRPVVAGECIGISGNSGLKDMAPHLHFSYKKQGFDKNNGYMGCSDPAEYFVGPITYL